MIGLGLGGFGGGMESALTMIGLTNVDGFLHDMGRATGAWDKLGDAQDRANRGAHSWSNQSTSTSRATDAQAQSVNRLNDAYGKLRPPKLSGVSPVLTMPSMAQRFQERLGPSVLNSPNGQMRLGSLGMAPVMASGSMIALGVASIKASNEIIESESLVATTYGKNTQRIIEWSEKRRKALGINSYEERRAAAGFQTQFLAAGLNSDKATELSKAFAEARDDFVSFYNARPQEVFAALQSGINGEAEPMRRFGTYLSDAAIKQYALAHGIGKANQELSEQDKLLARAGFILDSFRKGKAFGDLDRTKSSPTNQLRRVQNERDMAQVELGKSLQPIQDDAIQIANDIVPVAGKLVHDFASLEDSTRRWITYLTVGGVASYKLLQYVTGAAKMLRDLKGNPVGGFAGLAGDALGNSLNNPLGHKGGLFTNVAEMTVQAGVVNVNGATGLPGGAGGATQSLPNGSVPSGTASKVPGGFNIPSPPPKLPGGGYGWQAPAGTFLSRLFPYGVATRGISPISMRGLGMVARSPGAIGLGLGAGLTGAEVLRHIQQGVEDARIQKANDDDDKAVRSGTMTRQEARSRAAKRENERTTPDSFGEMAGNTGRRMLDVGKMAFTFGHKGYDWERGQFMSDTREQMKRGSELYRKDIEAARSRANQWALKYHRSFEESDVRYWESVIEIERNWAKQHAQNQNLSGFQTHVDLKHHAQEMRNKATYKYLDTSLEKWKDENKPNWREEEAIGQEETLRRTKQQEQYKVLKRAGYSEKRIAQEMDESPEGVKRLAMQRYRSFLQQPQSVADFAPGSHYQKRQQVQRNLTAEEQQSALRGFEKRYDEDHGTGQKNKAKPAIWDSETSYVSSLFGIGPKQPARPQTSMSAIFARRMGMEPILDVAEQGKQAGVNGGSAPGLLGSVAEGGNRELVAQARIERPRSGGFSVSFATLNVPPGEGDKLARDVAYYNRTPPMPMP